VPADGEATPLDPIGVKFQAGRFTKGREVMDGKRVIQFIKTVPIPKTSGYYGRELEHNARKHLVFKAMAEAVREQGHNPGFFIKALRLLSESRNEGLIDYDFDLTALLVNVETLAEVAGTMLGDDQETSLPHIGKTVYIVDSAHGDGGVQWVTANQSPIIKDELARGLYPDRAVEVPLDANPYGDLVTEYWPSVRALVRRTLLSEDATGRE